MIGGIRSYSLVRDFRDAIFDMTTIVVSNWLPINLSHGTNKLKSILSIKVLDDVTSISKRVIVTHDVLSNR